MLRSFLVNVILFGISCVIALFVIKVFDDWMEDRREARTERIRRERGRRYE